MRNMKKKGFTIVELVIVIAVIAILAGVLVPTFSDVVANANASAAQQEAANVYKQYCIDNAKDAAIVDNGTVHVDGYDVPVVDGQVGTAVECTDDAHAESYYEETAPAETESTQG